MAREENAHQPMNEVYLRGRISHMFGNERFGSLTIPYNEIVTKRVHDNGQSRFEQSVETYFPEALFNSSTKTKGIIQSFREGDYVLIKGYLGAYSFQSGAGFTERTAIYIDEIEHDVTRMEQMLSLRGLGGKHAEPANEIRLEAKVSGVSKRREDIYEIRLEVQKDGRTFAVTGMYFRAPQGLDQRIHLGDTVYVIGAMESSRTEYRGKVYFSQTFIIQELVTQKEFIEHYNAAQAAEMAAPDAGQQGADDDADFIPGPGDEADEAENAPTGPGEEDIQKEIPSL